MKLSINSFLIDTRPACEIRGHNFVPAPIPDGTVLQQDIFANVTPGISGIIRNTVIVGVYCTQCGQTRKLAY